MRTARSSGSGGSAPPKTDPPDADPTPHWRQTPWKEHGNSDRETP